MKTLSDTMGEPEGAPHDVMCVNFCLTVSIMYVNLYIHNMITYKRSVNLWIPSIADCSFENMFPELFSIPTFKKHFMTNKPN